MPPFTLFAQGKLGVHREPKFIEQFVFLVCLKKILNKCYNCHLVTGTALHCHVNCNTVSLQGTNYMIIVVV
jgi:hypothetical protein